MLNNINEIQFLERDELGEGAYSKVYKVRHLVDQQIYAVKYVCL
jgi:serine/threonine protein kinase